MSGSLNVYSRVKGIADHYWPRAVFREIPGLRQKRAERALKGLLDRLMEVQKFYRTLVPLRPLSCIKSPRINITYRLIFLAEST